MGIRKRRRIKSGNHRDHQRCPSFLSFGSKKDEIPDASNDEYDTHDEEQPLSPNNYDDDSENVHVDFADEEYYHDAEEEEESETSPMFNKKERKRHKKKPTTAMMNAP